MRNKLLRILCRDVNNTLLIRSCLANKGSDSQKLHSVNVTVMQHNTIIVAAAMSMKIEMAPRASISRCVVKTFLYLLT